MDYPTASLIVGWKWENQIEVCQSLIQPMNYSNSCQDTSAALRHLSRHHVYDASTSLLSLHLTDPLARKAQQGLPVCRALILMLIQWARLDFCRPQVPGTLDGTGDGNFGVCRLLGCQRFEVILHAAVPFSCHAPDLQVYSLIS